LLSQHLLKFAEDEDIPDEMLSPRLLRIAMTLRMVGYIASTAKPSARGLKLDLDRFRRDVEDVIRETKKDADGFITRMFYSRPLQSDRCLHIGVLGLGWPARLVGDGSFFFATCGLGTGK
jgi:hypothetical protein